MFKRSHYVALSLALLLTLVILNLPYPMTARLKLSIGSLFLPLFGLAGASHHLAGKAGDALIPRTELLKQNEELQKENQELRLRLMQEEETRRENAKLRQFFGWQQKTAWKVKLANVVLREPSNWWRTVEVDLGERDGVKVNLPVLSTEGFLVGRVSAVKLTRSQVILLGDPGCKAAARVEDDSRDTGVIDHSGPLETGFVEMGYLSRTANLKPGQNVVTSGLGGIFPKDIPIGKIVDSQTAEYGLYTVARVKLAANLNSLEEVWILFP